MIPFNATASEVLELSGNPAISPGTESKGDARAATAIGCYDYEADDPFAVGVGVFDRLTQGQKQVLLLQAAQALLDPNVQPPRITACLAAAADAVYHSMLGLVEIEIDIKEEGTKPRRRGRNGLLG